MYRWIRACKTHTILLLVLKLDSRFAMETNKNIKYVNIPNNKTVIYFS